MTWFESRYYSAKNVREHQGNLKKPNTTTFQVIGISSAEARRIPICEIEHLASLAHQEYYSNHVLCTVLWSATEARDLVLHLHTKTGT